MAPEQRKEFLDKVKAEFIRGAVTIVVAGLIILVSSNFTPINFQQANQIETLKMEQAKQLSELKEENKKEIAAVKKDVFDLQIMTTRLATILENQTKILERLTDEKYKGISKTTQ
jgi:hypothetical protein